MLLKERNMLLTMLHNYKESVANMPNEERLDKVRGKAKAFARWLTLYRNLIALPLICSMFYNMKLLLLFYNHC